MYIVLCLIHSKEVHNNTKMTVLVVKYLKHAAALDRLRVRLNVILSYLSPFPVFVVFLSAYRTRILATIQLLSNSLSPTAYKYQMLEAFCNVNSVETVYMCIMLLFLVGILCTYFNLSL